MSTREHLAAGIVMLLTLPAAAQGPKLGQPVAPTDITAWDISIGPDGSGTPRGPWHGQ